MPAHPHDPVAAAAPLVWRRTFRGDPEQSREVRRFVATLLDGSPYADDAVLAAAELAGNAVRHTKSGHGGTFTVQVAATAGAVHLSVTDQGGPTDPAPGDLADDLSESGRGLRTVAVLSSSWGWHGNGSGRTVTVTFTHPA